MTGKPVGGDGAMIGEAVGGDEAKTGKGVGDDGAMTGKPVGGGVAFGMGRSGGGVARDLALVVVGGGGYCICGFGCGGLWRAFGARGPVRMWSFQLVTPCSLPRCARNPLMLCFMTPQNRQGTPQTAQCLDNVYSDLKPLKQNSHVKSLSLGL